MERHFYAEMKHLGLLWLGCIFSVLLFFCTFVQPVFPITSKLKTFWDGFMWLSTECELSFVSSSDEVPRVWQFISSKFSSSVSIDNGLYC